MRRIGIKRHSISVNIYGISLASLAFSCAFAMPMTVRLRTAIMALGIQALIVRTVRV